MARARADMSNTPVPAPASSPTPAWDGAGAGLGAKACAGAGLGTEASAGAGPGAEASARADAVRIASPMVRVPSLSLNVIEEVSRDTILELSGCPGVERLTGDMRDRNPWFCCIERAREARSAAFSRASG